MLGIVGKPLVNTVGIPWRAAAAERPLHLKGQRRTTTTIPPLIPSNTSLPRLKSKIHSYNNQRPSKNVMGQIGYCCTDTCTPIYKELRSELHSDARLLQAALGQCDSDSSNKIVGSTLYLLPTHPRHHACHDGFGGYYYVNHAAALAAALPRPAILDLDYHCGNGTAVLFHDEENVMVVSLHCDPDFEYPFHNGFADESQGTTLHLPLPPRTNWQGYRVALEHALNAIQDFAPETLIISLGLDTHAGDPCAIRRAGFRLEGNDYVEMGKLLGSQLGCLSVSTTIFVQEGGYRMDRIATAAADVVGSFHKARCAFPVVTYSLVKDKIHTHYVKSGVFH